MQGQGGVLYPHEARNMVVDIEVNRAAVALKRARKVVDKVVKAPRFAIFNDAKVKLRELRSMRTQQTKLRKTFVL